ncbi:MAG: alpha/beta fold hydrolase [Mycobacteriales bacterium]
MSSSRVEFVDVPGGRLGVEVVSGATEPVLAIHGISSQRRLWDWLRIEAPELSLVAPDLRGRGDSVGVTGSSTMQRHALDMIAVLDALGVESAHVCGMSMGGFVAVEMAVRHPQRVRSLVLVDGGFPLPARPGLTREMLPNLFADRLGRLDRQWSSLEDYLAFFVAGTAPLLDPADPVLRGYLAHDLDASQRVRLRRGVFLDDAVDLFFGELPWTRVQVPTRLTYAEWSSGRDSAPAYNADRVASFQAALPSLLSVHPIPGVDHAGSIMTKTGAVATAETLAAALA